MTTPPYATDGEWRVRQKGGDWIAFPAKGPITLQQVATFPPKITIGETTKGAHPLLSTWAFGGLTSGSGIATHSGATTRRYRIGLAETRNSDFFNSPPKPQTYSGSDGFMPHNDLVVGGVRRLYANFGLDLHLWNENTLSFTDTTQNLADGAEAPGIAFEGTSTLKLYIPLGSYGYARWDGTTLTNVAASGSQPAVRDFVVLGSLLIALATNQQLWWSIDGSTWTSYGTAGKLPAGIFGWHLRIFKNNYGDKTVHISTDGGLFVFDPAGPTMYDTDLGQAPHPSLGRAMDRWRDQLYISGGMGARSWNGSSINPMGLDRNHGLPNAYRGRIYDLVGGLNSLYALVYGGGADYHSLHAWTGEGWEMLWRGDSNEGLNPMVISSAQSGYRLWWGFDTNALSLPISPDDANAEQQAEALTGVYERDWFLETGRNAFEMEGFTKKGISIKWEEYTADDGVVGFQYRTNLSDMSVDDGWQYPSVDPPVYPASSSTDGAWNDRSYLFGLNVSNGRYYGEPFEWIEFRWFGDTAASWTGPDIIRNVVFTFQKVVEGFRAFTARVDLQALYDEGRGDLADLINELVLAEEDCDFQYRQEVMRVSFSSWGGADGTGQANQDGTRTISIIEIPVNP